MVSVDVKQLVYLLLKDYTVEKSFFFILLTSDLF